MRQPQSEAADGAEVEEEAAKQANRLVLQHLEELGVSLELRCQLSVSLQQGVSKQRRTPDGLPESELVRMVDGAIKQESARACHSFARSSAVEERCRSQLATQRTEDAMWTTLVDRVALHCGTLEEDPLGTPDKRPEESPAVVSERLAPHRCSAEKGDGDDEDSSLRSTERGEGAQNWVRWRVFAGPTPAKQTYKGLHEVKGSQLKASDRFSAHNNAKLPEAKDGICRCLGVSCLSRLPCSCFQMLSPELKRRSRHGSKAQTSMPLLSPRGSQTGEDGDDDDNVQVPTPGSSVFWSSETSSILAAGMSPRSSKSDGGPSDLDERICLPQTTRNHSTSLDELRCAAQRCESSSSAPTDESVPDEAPPEAPPDTLPLSAMNIPDFDEGVIVAVTVPSHSGPGWSVTFTTPDGRHVSVVVPEGVRANEVFQVKTYRSGRTWIL